MAGLRISALSFAAVLAFTAAALSHEGCPVCGDLIGARSYVVPAAYFPAQLPICPCTPVRYAIATPAPASHGPDVLNTQPSTHEPPVGTPQKKGPTIYQNRTFSGIPQITEPRMPQAKVSFWNLSGYDVNLSIGDRIIPIAKDRAAIVDLDRHFTWRTNYHSAKTEDVPDDVNHFEVMIR